MRRIDPLLTEMCAKGSSDLFIKAGSPPCFRINGIISPSEHPSMTPDDVNAVAMELLNEEQRAEFEETHEMDMAIAAKNLGRFRVNIFRQRESTGMVLRHIPFPNFEFKQLRLPPAVQALSEKRRGLVLVTGTTGSGKSTTLAAMIKHINEIRQCHIMTIEDPIEFLHSDNRSIISQREVGIDTNSFIDGLKRVLRQSPDVILIGEMRDLETIQTAIAAAETGHLVFSTLHTTDAVQTVERIINYLPGYLQHQIRMELSLTLQGVISQRLLPTANGKGRVPATEIMVVTPVIKKMLLEGKTLELKDYIEDGAHVGMMTFDQSLLSLYNRKLISIEEAMANATSPDEFRLAAEGISTGVSAKDFSDFASSS
ncbi:MAG: type IV pilus twitching motility protein PilT [Candidatus Sumerlaeota bacterium]